MSSDDKSSDSLIPRAIPALRANEPPLVARAKAFMRRITQDQQTKYVVSQNRLGEAIERNIQLKTNIRLAEAQLDNIDKLVEREQSRVDLELRILEIAQEDMIQDAEVREAERVLYRAELGLRTLRLEKQLKQENAPPQEGARMSSVQRANAEIRRVNEDFASLIETFKAAAGDDEGTQEDLRELIALAEITKREKVQALMESM